MNLTQSFFYKFKKLSHSFYKRPLKINCIAEKKVNFNKLHPFKANNFPISGPLPWLDQQNYQFHIDNKLENKIITIEEAKYCKEWAENGFVIFENFFNYNELNSLICELDEYAIINLENPYSELSNLRFQDIHFKIKSLNKLMHDPRLLKIAEILLGIKVKPFQSLFFPYGSGQNAHSDSIHMTTYPLGYLLATWIALEDIKTQAGPLFYYPKSHRLPFVFSHQLQIPNYLKKMSTQEVYEQFYEPKIQSIIKSQNLEQKIVLAKKGDLIFWHANLIHGGSPRENLILTRKSIACHYFAKKVFCYHDLSGSKAHRMN